MSHFLQKKAVRFGIPFILFIVGGSFGLREFTELRYRYRKVSAYNVQKELEKHGIHVEQSEGVTIESEYEKIKDKTFDDWGNKRIERPWDE